MNEDNRLSVFDRVTHKIISDLEQGVRPWKKPWSVASPARGLMRPRRHNGEPYNGVNTLLLWDAALERGYLNPTWMTYRQAGEYGAHVRKGEKASFVVYASKVTKMEVDETTGEKREREIPFMRGYNVFNAEQIEGLPESFELKPEVRKSGRLAHVDCFLRNTGAVIRHGGDRAYYSEINDYIQIPFIDDFRDRESYYAILAHEATHWTKHESRLNRDLGRMFWGDEGYAREELVAEIGSAFLCADLGITPDIREDHAAYIHTWLEALKHDRKLIFTAAAHATRSVEFLKSRQPGLTSGLTAEEPERPCPETVYVSEPMEIDAHVWRLRIERAGRGLQIRYEFRDQSGSFWRPDHDWPQHDPDDPGSGLPGGLARLYRREQSQLARYGLISAPVCSGQLTLSF